MNTLASSAGEGGHVRAFARNEFLPRYRMRSDVKRMRYVGFSNGNDFDVHNEQLNGSGLKNSFLHFENSVRYSNAHGNSVLGVDVLQLDYRTKSLPLKNAQQISAQTRRPKFALAFFSASLSVLPTLIALGDRAPTYFFLVLSVAVFVFFSVVSASFR